MSKNCCSEEETKEKVSVQVNVDVPKIIKYLSVAAVLIVGIVFGTKTFQKMLDSGYFQL